MTRYHLGQVQRQCHFELVPNESQVRGERDTPREVPHRLAQADLASYVDTRQLM